MENKHTAVKWLFIELNNEIDNIPISKWDKITDIVQQALKMEKDQIINAFVKCWEANMPDGFECKLSAEEYYNETYKTE